jgi:shikimate dehydrogenase
VTRRLLWLVGDERIAHSPSPLLHDAVFGPGTYHLHACTVADDAFAHAEEQCRGINVTAPHKRAAAARYAQVLDARARQCGAANTVVYDDAGRAVLASNTDVEGLLVAWHRAAFFLAGQTLAVVGAGGAARAVVVAAAAAGAKRVLIHARRPHTGAELVNVAATVGLDATVITAEHDGRAPLVIVAASELDSPSDWLKRTLVPGGAVHDLRYGSRAHAVRDAALRAGALFCDGSSMLLGQAEAAARLFQGSPLAPSQRAGMAAAFAAWNKAVAPTKGPSA